MATPRRLRGVPRHLLVCEKSNFAHDKSRHRHLVETHYHNYRVSFLIPECGVLPPELSSLVAGVGPYYSVRGLPLYELIAPRFIEAAVSGGSCCALTYNTRVDEDSAAALLPNGRLVLSLDKDTYEESGLQGRASRYADGRACKYVVSIDLLDLAAHPGSKKAERVAWALRDKKPLKFDFLLAWSQTGAEEAALLAHFSGYRLRQHQPKVALSTVTDLQFPVLCSGALGGQPGASCDAPEFLQWLGAVFSGADLNNESSSFLSTCRCPQPSSVAARASLCTIVGLILPETVCLLLDGLRRYFEEPKLAPWVTLSVQGFADSPVSWGQREHGFRQGGEHLYSFVLFGNQDYWLQMAVGAHDDCPP